MSLTIYTDGGCVPNPGRAGWGFVAYGGPLPVERFGVLPVSTNNRAEMTALLEAMRFCADGSRPTIWSDSQYAIKGCTIWRRGWQARGYMGKGDKKGSPIPNADLWRALHAEMDRVKPVLHWCRGHSGIAGNERADQLAEIGRMLP